MPKPKSLFITVCQIVLALLWIDLGTIVNYFYKRLANIQKITF